MKDGDVRCIVLAKVLHYLNETIETIERRGEFSHVARVQRLFKFSYCTRSFPIFIPDSRNGHEANTPSSTAF